MKFNDDKSLLVILVKIFYKSGGKRMDFVFNVILDVFKEVFFCSGSKVVILVIGGFLV